MNWLLLHTEKINLGKAPPTASPYREPQPVTFDPGVFNLCDKCHISCCRDLGHDYDYSEPSPVLIGRAMICLICNVKL